VLRAALAPALGLAPEGLRFGREDRGRPFLLADGAPDFNLSDTDGGTLVALCPRGRVGVDLERRDRRPAVARLARRYFHPGEAEALEAMAPEAAREAFLRLWTAKEASCKATGTGIFGWLPAWRFEPSAEQPQLLVLPPDAGDATRWRHWRIAPAATHTAVIALRDGAGLCPVGYRLDLD
jgi:4'-phosphopantetheinyl transferase